MALSRQGRRSTSVLALLLTFAMGLVAILATAVAVWAYRSTLPRHRAGARQHASVAEEEVVAPVCSSLSAVQRPSALELNATPREPASAARSQVPVLPANPIVRSPMLTSVGPHVTRCRDPARPDLETRRMQYLETFVPTVTENTTIASAPSVPIEAVAAIENELRRVQISIQARLGLNSVPPTIYIYPSVALLREYACAPGSVAYYDGAIHLAVVPPNPRFPHDYADTIQNLKHEYVHHALMSNGITRPIWFQEGEAMMIANEQEWSLRPLTWKAHALPLEQMVLYFPDTTNVALTQAFYGQAYLMVEFLDRLCVGRPTGCGARELVDALKTGRADAATLFDWAVAERGRDLVTTPGLPLWEDYLKNGNFSAAQETTLLERALRLSPH